MTDDLGILSVYVTVDPREESSTKPAYKLRTRQALAALQADIEARDKGLRKVLTARLAELEPDIVELLDSREPGIGRALFAPLSTSKGRNSDDVIRIAIQQPLTDAVLLDKTAVIRPLLEASTFGAPAGLCAVSHDGIRLISLAYGQARELQPLAIEVDTDQWRQYKGPGGDNPQLGQHSASHRDNYDQRLEEHVEREVRTLASTVTKVANKQSWETLLLTGDQRLVNVLADTLPENGEPVIRSGQIVDSSQSPAHLANVFGEEFCAARRMRATDLATRTRDIALAHGLGAVGLADTLHALQNGQVSHLLLAAEQEWQGSWDVDGKLVPAGRDSTVDKVGERMIELALHSDAEVTILPPEAAELLDGHDGVAAGLRWP